MNSKHTAGPWAVSRDAVPEGHVQNTIYAEGSGERVATAFLVEENAHLIAAAPDLLAALEYFTDQVEQFKPYHVTSLGLDYAMQQANIAIRQARGR